MNEHGYAIGPPPLRQPTLQVDQYGNVLAIDQKAREYIEMMLIGLEAAVEEIVVLKRRVQQLEVFRGSAG